MHAAPRPDPCRAHRFGRPWLARAVAASQAGVYQVSPTLRLVYPPLERFGIVHAKLMLLRTKTFLRVVVSSANLTAEDWGLLDQVRHHRGGIIHLVRSLGDRAHPVPLVHRRPAVG